MGSILHDLIFLGKVKKNFTICDVIFTFSTLSKKDENELDLNKQNTTYDKIDFIIKILIKSIVCINYSEKTQRQMEIILYLLPLNFLIKLYDGYKSLSSMVIADVNKSFVEFLNSQESDIQWEVLKTGFLFEQPLNDVQKSWIYYRSLIEKNKEFEQNFSLTKYAISHITHATINPKTYVNMMKKEQQQEEMKNLQDSGAYVDLAKDYFDQVFASIKDEKKVAEIFRSSIEHKDEHDLIVFEQAKIEFKNTIRYRRNRRFTIEQQKRPNIIIGQKQEFTLDAKVETSIFVRGGVNYEDIIKSKQFFDISYEIKMQLLEEVLLEDIQEVQLDESKKKFTTNIPKNGKTIRELLGGGKTIKELLGDKQ